MASICRDAIDEALDSLDMALATGELSNEDSIAIDKMRQKLRDIRDYIVDVS